MSIIASESCQRLKRHASEIVSQLPPDRDSALRVLDYARELVEWEAGSVPALRIVTPS